MDFLEKVNPNYLDLLLPLKKWKILNVQSLKTASEYQGTNSGFYKVISKLEKNLLIESFTNMWSSEKFVYLLPKGHHALGIKEGAPTINTDSRFHDAIVSSVARFFEKAHFTKEVYLDFQMKEHFPLLERTPDCLIEGEFKNKFRLAVEVELTQKSLDRLRQIFRTYSSSKVVNQILYITDKKSIFDAYTNFFQQQGGEIIKEKFMFMWATDLSKGKADLAGSPVLFKGKMSSLGEILNLT